MVRDADRCHVQWSRSPDGTTVTLSSADTGAGSESETYRYVASSRAWDVQAVSRSGGSDAGNSVTYQMRDVASAPDDKGALAGDEWYQWRYAFLRGAWHAVARRPCGRTQPPSM